jgi:bifunctional non-homologous end joining protein LigD
MQTISSAIQLINLNLIDRISDDFSRYFDNCAYLQIYGMKKHHASRLHYDLRLGWNGVLLSWAIPLGPNYCPKISREAIEVQDHRQKYLRFEGVYAKGKPGAGVTMLWDEGLWTPLPGYLDVDRALHHGELRFVLKGGKLLGAWILRRTASRDFSGNPIWMLTKERGSYARCPGDIEIVQEMPNSILDGRSLEDIQREWHEPHPARVQPTLFEM